MSFLQLRTPFLRNALSTPTVSTQAATGVASTSATGNGTLTSIGASPVSAKGFVWATHTSPTLADNVVTDGTINQGTFSDSLTGLPSSTQIYYAAYATNFWGTVYGADQTFTTTAGAASTELIGELMMLGVGT